MSNPLPINEIHDILPTFFQSAEVQKLIELQLHKEIDGKTEKSWLLELFNEWLDNTKTEIL